MNALRRRADEVFGQQRFVRPEKEPATYGIIRVSSPSSSSSPSATTFEELALPAEKLPAYVDTIATSSSGNGYGSGNTEMPSSLHLVCFDCDESPLTFIIRSSRAVFDDVYRALGLCDYGKYLLCKNSSGFYRLNSAGPRLHFFLGMKACAMVYTYDVATRSTAGILVNITPRGENPFYSLRVHVRHSAHLAPHPAYLPTVALLTLAFFARDASREALRGVVTLGTLAAVDVWAPEILSLDPQSPQHITRLDNTIHLLGPMLGELDHVRRYFVVADQVEQRLADGAIDALVRDMDSDILRTLSSELDEVLRFARYGLEADRKNVGYWYQRARDQLQTTFNMISRGDVLASIKLAEVARDNSSSMKVVAIMTMAFLPATFFAALFSMPSLKWDEERVVTDRFWVFWAFALPSTLFIFALWALMTRQQVAPSAWANPWRDMRARLAKLLAAADD